MRIANAVHLHDAVHDGLFVRGALEQSPTEFVEYAPQCGGPAPTISGLNGQFGQEHALFQVRRGHQLGLKAKLGDMASIISSESLHPLFCERREPAEAVVATNRQAD